jgi:hypothetical protein
MNKLRITQINGNSATTTATTAATTTRTLWITKAIVISKAWYYRVSFNYNADINYGINAMRWCVLSSMAWKTILLDDKKWEPSGYAMNMQATSNAKNDIAFSKQVSFSRSDVTFLEADTRVFVWWRIAPYVIVWPWSWIDAWAVVRRAWLASWVLWLWTALENSEAGCALSVQRVANEDWWLLYI